MNFGKYFIPSMRRECLIRLSLSLENQGNIRSRDSFARLLNEYSHKHKDLIFLVNEDVKKSRRSRSLPENIKDVIEEIFLNHFEDIETG